MTWRIEVGGHAPDDIDAEQAEVKEAVRVLVRTLREAGHTVSSHTVNGEDVEAQ